jgi:hypothetical protein
MWHHSNGGLNIESGDTTDKAKKIWQNTGSYFTFEIAQMFTHNQL